MHCLNCNHSNLYSSTILTIEERQGLLKDITCFVLCRGCGYVMLKHSNGELIHTHGIKDQAVIALAYEKLFKASAFSGTAPSQYGLTQHGEKQSVSKLKDAPKVAVPESIPAPDLKVVENKTYPHVNNPEPKLTIFGKVAKFVDKMLDKIFSKSS